MARKKLTKKTNKVSIKVKRKSKITSLTVAQILKKLPKQIKKELTVLKKQAVKLTSALKKAEKKRKSADVALTKKSTARKMMAAKKAFKEISQTVNKLTHQSEIVNQSVAFLTEKQAAVLVLTGPIEKKITRKAKKVKAATQTRKKSSKNLQLPNKEEPRVVETVENVELIEETLTPALETEGNV